MNGRPLSWLYFLGLRHLVQPGGNKRERDGAAEGFTLVQLLVASSITAIVVGTIFNALLTAMNANTMGQAITRRRIDLSRAFDFMSYEIRRANRINQTATMAADGVNTVADTIASSGLNLSNLGSYSTLVLYLEIPIASPIPTTCPPGGPNAGLPPPEPAEYDRVVYDIRPSRSEWLAPRSINRYGRIPELDGSIDPCSNPIASDVLVDAIADTVSSTPTCTGSGVLSGAEGFHACVNGAQVQLFFESNVVGIKRHNLTSSVSSRLSTFNTTPLPTPVLSGTRQVGTDTMNLSWTWTGPSATFKVYETLGGGASTEIYSGNTLSTTSLLSGNSGDETCYTVTATAGSVASPESNSVCEPK